MGEDAVFKTELVVPMKLRSAHGVVAVGISGGSDSDIVIDLIERHRGSADVRYVWFDTGAEYEASKRHLLYLEERYGVEIAKRGAVIPVPISCKRKGVPFMSKRISDEIQRLQKHGFDWSDRSYEELLKEYPNCMQALKWWCNYWPPVRSKKDGGAEKKSSQNINVNAYLKEFMIDNHPDFTISPYCCDGAKKKTKDRVLKEFDAVLNITGERRAEGGVRATAYESCFSPATEDKIAQYRPIFFWTDDDKRAYECKHRIVHSDCYSVWGMKRTGCAGCPFGSRFEEELELMKRYEPKLYAAAIGMFEKSYEYTRKYREYKANKKLEKSNEETMPR